MTFFGDLTFFFYLILGMIPAAILGYFQKNRRFYILSFSLLMVFGIYKSSLKELVYLGAFVFLEWHVIVLFQWLLKKYGKNQAMFHHFVIFALCPLLISKLSSLVHLSCFSFLGISYVTFKVVQIIIESYDGLIEKSDFLDTVSFILFFPSLSSGPIDRSKRFEADLHRDLSRNDYMKLMESGLFKICLGILYKFAFSNIAYDYLQTITGRYDPGYLVLYAYVYGIYMFFDFAGYSLMAVGSSYMLGIVTPDNFNKPFISVDMKDFWDRWHISLSHWFRDFIFTRYIRAALKNKWFKNRLNAASSGFIVNMLVMGVWHGLSIDYIIYGLYHGILLALTEIFQKKSKFYKKNKNKKWYRLLSWFVTINLVMFGFLIFSGYANEAAHILIFKLL